jgi:xanthine/uracil permease
MSSIGYPLGILIGIITGYVFMLFFQSAMASSNVKFSKIMKLSTQLLAMPTFWFGGPWITTQFLESVNLAESLPKYLISLALTFLLIVAWPLGRFVISVGNQVGEAQRREK